MRFPTLRKPMLGLIMALVLGVAAFAVTGCGSDNDNTASTSDASEEKMEKDDAMMKEDDAMMAKEGVEVGGAMMTPDRDIVANASDASNVTTLVELVGLAGLVETLQGEGPFTVFAPDNDAFAKLPEETVASLQEPENKEALANILTYHVVAEQLDAAKITELAENGETIKTVQGEELTPKVDGKKVTITDANGDTVTVTQADVKSSNGVTHIIDSVLMPKS